MNAIFFKLFSLDWVFISSFPNTNFSKKWGLYIILSILLVLLDIALDWSFSTDGFQLLYDIIYILAFNLPGAFHLFVSLKEVFDVYLFSMLIILEAWSECQMMNPTEK